MRELVLGVSVLAGCLSSCRGGAEPQEAGRDGATKEATKEVAKDAAKDVKDVKDAKDPCGAAALGLAAATALAPWTPPAGCTPRGQGTAIVRTAAELDGRLACAGGASHGFDLASQGLVAVAYTMSPASVGLIAYDDGKTVTLVSRQRSPCPDDPLPMPMQGAAWFVLPTGGERTLADAVCTVESTCR